MLDGSDGNIYLRITTHKLHFYHFYNWKFWFKHCNNNFALLKLIVNAKSSFVISLWIWMSCLYTYSWRIERPRTPENGYLDEIKSGWREEHGEELLHLLLKLCKDGTISQGNVTQEAWRRIQNGLQNLTNCTFEIYFLEERLRDYKQLYSLLAETSSQIFDWDRENKTICINSNLWRKVCPEFMLYDRFNNIPYFLHYYFPFSNFFFLFPNGKGKIEQTQKSRISCKRDKDSQ